MIAHFPRRRARAHLFSMSGRGVLLIALALTAALVGFGVAVGGPDREPQRLTPYAWIGR